MSIRTASIVIYLLPDLVSLEGPGTVTIVISGSSAVMSTDVCAVAFFISFYKIR